MPWATNRSRARGLQAIKAELKVLELVFAGRSRGKDSACTSFTDAESMADAYTVRLGGVERYAVRGYVCSSSSQGNQRVFLPLIEAARKAREAADRGESPVRPELARCFVYSRSHPLFVIGIETHEGVPPGCVSVGVGWGGGEEGGEGGEGGGGGGGGGGEGGGGEERKVC